MIKKFVTNIGTQNLTNRQNWVINVLKSFPSGLKILDAGAGECQYKKYCNHLNYESQDFNQYDGIGDEIGLQTGSWDTSSIDIISDITNIPRGNDVYDIVLCTEVFEHIPDPILAIKEFQRILKPGGFLIITAPFNSLTHFAPFHYYGGFNKYFYEWHLPLNGFQINEISSNGDYSEFVAQEIRRVYSIYGNPSILIKCCIAFLLRYIFIKKKSFYTENIGCNGFHVLAKKIER